MAMAGIRTGIELNDEFTSVIYGIINSVNLAVSAMADMQQGMNADIDTSSLEGARDEINQATAAMNELNAAMQNQTVPDISSSVIPATDQNAASDITLPVVNEGNQAPVSVPVQPVIPNPLVENPPPIETSVQLNAPPDPVEVPVVWQSDNLDVFTGTGIERFQQEVQSTNAMLEQLSNTQDAIAMQAYNTDILPPEAFQDLNRLASRINLVRDRIQQIESNPVNIGTDAANAELEQLRSQLNQAITAQNDLNSAMERMDVGDVNSAYMTLSQTVSNTERYIRDNTDEQGAFNQKVQEGIGQADNLTNTIKGAVAAYVSIQSVGKALNISDELTQTIARLNLMNDGAQFTRKLFDMIYVSAQNTHSPLMATADAIAKMGNNAGAAFNSNAELVAFMEQVNKQFAIGGASAVEQSNALMQLSQAMAAGALRGDELNSILDAAPGIARAIEQSMGWAEGSIKSYAEEGAVTAQVVKQSLLDMADETNAAYESMPYTFSKAMTDIQGGAIRAFQPVLEYLNGIADSQGFQDFVNGAIEAMATLANIVLNIFDLVAQAGTFIADNWSIISPIVYGVIGALAAYIIVAGIVAAINGITATANTVQAASSMLAAGATLAQTAAQYGLNAALLACPITWIIVLIIALIAIIFAVCNAIAKMTGVATSGFGVIMGAIFVVGAAFENLWFTILNVVHGIGGAIAALGSNMKAAFHNAISSVQAWFYDLLSTACSVIESIAAALNELPFVEFDYSGITAAANDYAAKSAAAAGNKEDYTSISDAFSEGMSTYDTFQRGWASDAFGAGAAWGDGISDKVSNFSLSDVFGKVDMPSADDYSTALGDAMAANGTAGNLDDIAGNTGSMADSMDITQEELKYMRDIAEQEAINRYTTAEIKIEQTNHNNISSDMDIDGVIDGMTDAVNEAIEISSEGVHT